MKAPENNENKKRGGFLAVLSKIFGGSAASGGTASGLASTASGFGGLSGLFASKAGIVGMVLGGATIAAGVGVVYNFVGPSSKPVYSPSLFENQYYESEVESAGAKRMADNDSDAANSSSLDYFRDEAKKDGIGFGDIDDEGVEGEVGSASADGADNLASASADGSASGDGNEYDGNASMANIPRLQKAPSFGAGGGGSRSKITLGGKGMSGGIGSKFQKIYKTPTGRASSMKGALAARASKSAKYNLPNFNRKGAFGQAKGAKNISKKAAYSDSSAGAKTTAIEAFQGETAGVGDVGPEMGGVGIGGAGVSDGGGLKGSDPSLNNSEFTPPKVDDPVEASPWKKYEDMALYGMLAAALLIFITNILVNSAKAKFELAVAAAAVPGGAAAAAPLFASAASLFAMAKITAIAAMVAASVVTFAGIMLMRGDPGGDPAWEGQKWMGIMYTVVGGYLLYSSYTALAGAKAGAITAKGEVAAGKEVALKGAENGLLKAEQAKTFGITPSDCTKWNAANPNATPVKIVSKAVMGAS